MSEQRYKVLRKEGGREEERERGGQGLDLAATNVNQPSSEKDENLKNETKREEGKKRCMMKMLSEARVISVKVTHFLWFTFG